jgi:hypothetical protein
MGHWLRHRKIEGGGREWYQTTVNEIQEIYAALLGDGVEP